MLPNFFLWDFQTGCVSGFVLSHLGRVFVVSLFAAPGSLIDQLLEAIDHTSFFDTWLHLTKRAYCYLLS